MEVISEKRRKKCQLYVTPVLADIIIQLCFWAVGTMGVAWRQGMASRELCRCGRAGSSGLEKQTQVRRRAASLTRGSSAADSHPQGRS